MPWTPQDAERHTKKANTPAKRQRWASAANRELERSGDEVRAVRYANGIVKKMTRPH